MLTPQQHAEAVRCALTTAKLVSAIASRSHDDPQEAARYGFSPAVRRLAEASHSARSPLLYRVDLLYGMDGFRACEINADCPGGHNEALCLFGAGCRLWSGHNPTSVVAALCDALCALRHGEGTIALIYATAYAEDLQVCALVQRELHRRNIPAVLASPTALRRMGKGLRIGKERISVLYRYFPTEYMDGQRNLSAIADAVEHGEVRTLSNFAEIYTQSKLAFARACTVRFLA